MSKERLPFGEWLRREIVDRLGTTASRFAMDINVDPGTVSRWINGKREPDVSGYIAIAEGLNRQVEEVLYHAGRLSELPQPLSHYERERVLRELQEEIRQGFKEIRDVSDDQQPQVSVLFHGRVPADSMRWTNAGEEERKVRVPESWLGARSAKEFFIVEASGDCLSDRPYGILSGFYVLLRRSLDEVPRNGEVVLIRLGDEYSLKVWSRDGDWIELHDSFGTLISRFSIMEDYAVIGRYVTHWSPVPGSL